MAKSGQNVNDIKNSNRSLLLNVLYYEGAQSRKALAQKSNLTPAAITSLIAEFIAEGAVVETEKITVEGRLGRNEQLIDINYPSLYVVGIRFGVNTFEVNLVRLDGKMTAQKEYTFESQPLEKVAFGQLVSSSVQDLLSEAAVDTGHIVCAGFTIRGIVDSENGMSIDSYGILEKNTSVITELRKHLSFPVAVENNVRSMLRSDSILRHVKPLQSTLFIKYGPGVGGALLVGQKNFLGSCNRAIELGHICVEDDGDRCVCGKQGCLETVVSYSAIVKNAQKVFSLEQTPVLFEICNADKSNITIQKIFLAYEKNDSGVNRLFESVIKRFAVSIANSAALLDPEIVLLASDAFKIKKFAENMQNAIFSYSGNHKPRYLIIADSRKLDSRGAACVAINNFLATGAKDLRDKRNASKGSAK